MQRKWAQFSLYKKKFHLHKSKGGLEVDLAAFANGLQNI